MAAEKSTHQEEADKWMQLKIWKIREFTSALVSKNSRKLIMRSLSEVRNGNKLIAQNIICHLEKHAFLRSYKLIITCWFAWEVCGESSTTLMRHLLHQLLH